MIDFRAIKDGLIEWLVGRMRQFWRNFNGQDIDLLGFRLGRLGDVLVDETGRMSSAESAPFQDSGGLFDSFSLWESIKTPSKRKFSDLTFFEDIQE